MSLRNVVMYVLFGTSILLVAVAGLAYISVIAKKPVRPVDQADAKPNFAARQEPGKDDSVQPCPEQSVEHSEFGRQLADSLFEKGEALVGKGHFYEAFAKIREAFEKDPAEIKYRKLLTVLQRLSSTEFALRRIEAKWKDQVKGLTPETPLSEAQKVYQRVNSVEIESNSVPATFSAARERLLARASKLVDEVALELMEKPVREELDRAWRRLDWSNLEQLIARVREQTTRRQSGEFRKLAQITDEILRRHEAHLSAKSDHNYERMAVLLTEMMSQLPSDNGQDSENAPERDTFTEVRQWLKREWDSVLPQVESRFGVLCDDARSLLQEYAKNPITDDEISNWGTATDYGPVAERVKLLNTTHSKLTEAVALAEAVPTANLDRPLSLGQVKSEIHRVCAAAYKKAYILENVYGDLDAAGRVHKVVATLPGFENNDYPENARGWLEEHHLW